LFVRKGHAVCDIGILSSLPRFTFYHLKFPSLVFREDYVADECVPILDIWE